MKELFPEEDIDILYDWELQANSRLPKINMATAGHAAGMAYLNRPEEVTEKTWDRKMYGCSISPKYGGWFGLVNQYNLIIVLVEWRNVQR